MTSSLNTTHSKIVISALAVFLVGLAYFGTIDRIGEQYTDAALTRALTTFGVARALNGAISVAQGTEVSISPAGVGLNLTPGQVLDPLNDLIERFSWVMLMSSTSLGIQEIFIRITATPVMSVAVGLFVGLSLLLLWRPDLTGPAARRILMRLALMLLILRFAIPVAAIGSEGIYHFFLSEQYQQSTELLHDTGDEISDLNQANQQAGREVESSWMPEWASQMVDSAAERLDIEGRMERYRSSAEQAIDHTINLIVVFVIQTILLPLFFLWLMVRAVRRVWA